MEHSTVVGLDIAKSVFHTCEMNASGRVLERKRLYRDEVLEFFANHPPCLVAIESCGGSSYWARELEKLGHEVRLISAQFVKPYVKSQKNDMLDAEAICEAALRPQMRFVSANTVEQQDLQNIHRVRERVVKQRTMLANQIRGLLLEYGITIPQGVNVLRQKLSQIITESSNSERHLWREIFVDLRDELEMLTIKVNRYDTMLRRISKAHPVCARLLKLRGIGSLTATAIVAAVGNPSDFKNGRQLSAWLGLVPKQNTTGGNPKLLGITKRGDRYLRKLLIHGARIETRFANKRGNIWLINLKKRVGFNKAAVALANKNARNIWAILTLEDKYHNPTLTV